MTAIVSNLSFQTTTKKKTNGKIISEIDIEGSCACAVPFIFLCVYKNVFKKDSRPKSLNAFFSHSKEQSTTNMQQTHYPIAVLIC